MAKRDDSASTRLPDGIIADTLNARARRVDRMKYAGERIPLIHVSSLIKSSANDFFCAREFALRWFERAQDQGAGTPPKFELLWAVGHYYGDYIVQKFLERNPDWAKYAWGDWTCVCGESHRQRTTLPEGQLCNNCGKPINRYLEVDLFNPSKTVIGHADLIFLVNDVFYIYEFKSINRADVIFDEINDPLGDHLAQASNYYYMLKAEGHKVSKRIRFVYVDRSMDGLYTQNPFREVTADAIPPRRLANFYKRADTAISSIKNGKLPPRVCDDIGCARAKQCSRAITCFYRKKPEIKRIPSASMPRSLASESTAPPSTGKKNGSVGRSKARRKTGRTRGAS